MWWRYWFSVRPGGINTDPDVKDLREPSPNPIVT